MSFQPLPFPTQAALSLIRLALSEDIGSGDVTAALTARRHTTAYLVCKGNGVICGLPLIKLIYQQIDPRVRVTYHAQEGKAVKPRQRLAHITGPAQSLLTGERTVLNLLCALSGMATLTRRYVDTVRGTVAKIYDTRKTQPGLRQLSKYAVRTGGGFNHRMGLYDMVLIKDNHLTVKGITEAVQKAKLRYPDLPVEVEVENLVQLKEALSTKADIIMLDNMTLSDMKKAVVLTKAIGGRTVRLEASGGITLRNLREVAKTGVHRIAIGALTHSYSILDISMDFK